MHHHHIPWTSALQLQLPLLCTQTTDHQYPDGLVLLTGTMFAPVEDCGKAGEGFTHHEGDVVSISSAKLGTLVNTVAHCDKAPPWEFGLTALMRSLVQRGLLN